MPARRPRTFAPVMMAGAVLLLAAVPARAQDAHGAIAFGKVAQDPAVAYGFAWDYSTRDEAQEAAMNACLDSGGSNCAVLAWFQNGCGALAMDQYGMAQGKGSRTQEQAEARALRTCEAAEGVGCAVVASACVSSDGQPDTWSGSESVLVAPEETAGPTGPTAEPAAAQERPATDAVEDEGLTSEERMQVQQGLAALGFDAGPADGMFGPRTRSAIREWQQAKGLETTGYLSREEAEVLAAAGAREQAASRETAVPDESGNQVLYFAAAGPKCADLGDLGKTEAACWQEVQSQPGCYIWNERYGSDHIADWTGECSGDTAHGSGSYSLSTGSEYTSFTGSGSFMHGKQNGHWVKRYDSGDVYEGSYVDGKQSGHWVGRSPDGLFSEGLYVDGGRHGHWVTRLPSGRALEGPYVDGKRNGHWVVRDPDGDVSEGLYVDGERHGHWVLSYVDGKVEEGPYVGWDRHGHWVIRHVNGNVEEGPYVDDERHGKWVWSFADGDRLESEYRNGSRDGQPGVFLTAAGNRYPGRWSGECFRDAQGRAWAWYGTKEDACRS